MTTMMEWDQDPELKEMREGFIASFKDRRELLARALMRAPQGTAPWPEEVRKELQYVAHKLAGVAATYGFPTLTDIGAAIDDWLDLPEASRASGTDLREAGLFLDEAIRLAMNGQDPSGLSVDARMARLKMLCPLGE